LERLILFYASLDEQVFYFGYPGAFFLNEIRILLHRQLPSPTI